VTTITETIQAIVRHELGRMRIAELGLVEAVYPHSAAGDGDNYGCDVRLKNSGLRLRHVPVATGHIGTVAVPNVGDLVLLAFFQGDVNQPILIGRLYSDADRPPLNNPDEIISRLPLAADDDRTIRSAIRNIGTNDPPREVIVEMPPKITLRITDGTVRATAGRTEMTLDQPDGGGGTVTVVAGATRITLDQDGDVTVESQADIELTAHGDLTLQGTNVSIKASGNADIEATGTATVQGDAGATVKSTTRATLQGTSVQIQGITSFSP
jgi:phage baseplate assembly protein gpV